MDAPRTANVLRDEKEAPAEHRSPDCADSHWSGVPRGAAFTFEVAFEDSTAAPRKRSAECLDTVERRHRRPRAERADSL
jgi:hypothetical protein